VKHVCQKVLEFRRPAFGFGEGRSATRCNVKELFEGVEIAKGRISVRHLHHDATQTPDIDLATVWIRLREKLLGGKPVSLRMSPHPDLKVGFQPSLSVSFDLKEGEKEEEDERRSQTQKNVS